MLVVLLRHGPAEERDDSRWPNDAERPLSVRGAERTRAGARGLRRLVPTDLVVLASPLARAQGTAHIVRDVLGTATVETTHSLAPGGSQRGVLAEIARLAARAGVVLIGHEPDLGALGGDLMGLPRPLPLKKAGACAFEFDDTPREGAGRLVWYLPPRVLRRLGRKDISTHE